MTCKHLLTTDQLDRTASVRQTESVDLLLTDHEAAALLTVGVSTFRRYVAQGLVRKPLKLGGTSRWPHSEILEVIEAAKARREAPAA